MNSGRRSTQLLSSVLRALNHQIERGDLLDILEHPNPERYGVQRIFVVRREDYVHLVPFVEDEHTVFLKTIIPSLKATKEYLGEDPHEDCRRREGAA